MSGTAGFDWPRFCVCGKVHISESWLEKFKCAMCSYYMLKCGKLQINDMEADIPEEDGLFNKYLELRKTRVLHLKWEATSEEKELLLTGHVHAYWSSPYRRIR
ncbi:MAG TPA: hypothetical protein VIY47_01570 [Ignavibacteriaceae bacterium]